MKTYRVTFRLNAPSLTLWQADTLFGHLCWALLRQSGETALHELLLTPCRIGNPPLLLSDGFPPDAFPHPLLSPPRPVTEGEKPLAAQIAQARAGKSARDRKWLTGAEFQQVLQGQPLEIAADEHDPDAAKEHAFTTLHNQINRMTGTTAGTEEDAGNLYAVSGDWPEERVFYLRVADDIAFDWRELLNEVALSGYGKRKSVGYGAMQPPDIKPFTDFDGLEDANGFVSLSAFVPAANDPTDGYWRTEVKYGKLGEEYANVGNPFKRPLLRLLAGAVFRETESVRPFYGRLVDGVAPGMPQAAQYAFAFAVPMRLPIQEVEELSQ